MRVFALALCVSALLWAQSPTDVFSKAPPEVDKRLRERIEQFFKLYASGKFRTAEELVHEDSKDHFYNAAKSPLISYEVVDVKYSDNFTKAVVMTTVELDWDTPRLGRIRVKPPMKTLWKLDQGQWWWYTEPKTWETPWGVMRAGEQPAGPAAAVRRMTVSDFVNQIQIGNRDIRLKAWEASEATGSITNNMPGEVEFKLDDAPLPAGLTVTLSKTKLARGETATVTFRYDPPNRWNKPDREVAIVLVETGIPYKFRVTFAPDPEAQKIPQGRP
jgi:hypothetical protein